MDSFSYINARMKKGSEVTNYTRLYRLEGLDLEQIESLTFTGIYVMDLDYRTLYENEEAVCLKTSAYAGTLPTLSGEGTVLFENDSICIRGLGFEEERYYYEVQNKTAYRLEILAKEGKVGDTQVYLYGGDEELSTGGVCRNGVLYCYEDVWETRTEDTAVLANFEVKCKEYPELNFATGYLELKQP